MLSKWVLQGKVRKWQQRLVPDYRRGYTIRFVRKAPGVYTAQSEFPRVEGSGGETVRDRYGALPRVKAIVVGLDIREYSRRTPDEQLFLTLWLHSAVRKALDLLSNSLITTPEEPRIIVQTGDGAYVVFTFLDAWDPFDNAEATATEANKAAEEALQVARGASPALPEPGRDGAEKRKAEERARREQHEVRSKAEGEVYRRFSQSKDDAERLYVPVVASRAFGFVFALNAIVEADNARKGFDVGDGADAQPDAFAVFPVRVRYALSYDDVLLLEDINGSLNCVGSGMVTCARILATDHGEHLLLQSRILSDLDRWDGLNRVADGQWGQRLHHAMLPEIRVKTGALRYADVFGFYHDGPLGQGLGWDAGGRHTYHIGSHDVRALDQE